MSIAWHVAACSRSGLERLDYHLLVDGVAVGDPRNPRRVPSGYGPRVELCMSAYAEYHEGHSWAL